MIKGGKKVSKRIYLLRHAKSDWMDMALSDHKRPLNERGEKAADLVGCKLALKGFSPDLVYCSTAKRAVETLERVMTSGGFNWHVEHRGSLYGASADTLLTFIHQADPACDALLFVGHNPGFQDLALALAAEEKCDNGKLKKLRKKFPTGAFLCLEFDVDTFPQIAVGGGILKCFMRPKYEFLQYRVVCFSRV